MSFLYLFRRIFHWGPLLALSIIACITFTTLQVTSMWLPPFLSVPATVNHVVFLLFVGLTLYNFFNAMFIGPGYVAFGWEPNNRKECHFLQYCHFCKGFKAPRAHHCRKCNRCVMKMDHHCPWINNCCGHKNQANFTIFLLSAVFGCIQASVLLCLALYRAFYINWHFLYGDKKTLVYLSLYPLVFTIFSLGLALGIVVAVGGLFYIQMKSILKNETSIENWIVLKALGRSLDREDEFIYPYNLGWLRNFKQVFWDPLGNGITWVVLPGCEQYTLTKEQIIQKEVKRAQMRRYTIIKPYSGSWFPISKGICTIVNSPCSDEARIPLSLGDAVCVTREIRYWLYGEKIQDIVANPDSTRIRGWFPRCCAVEFIGAECEEVRKISKKIK